MHRENTQTLYIYIEKKTTLHTYILIYTEKDRDLAGNVDGVGLCSQKIPIFFFFRSFKHYPNKNRRGKIIKRQSEKTG